MIDAEKTRRELMRWVILLSLHHGSPNFVYEELILSTVQGVISDATSLELRRHLDYLADRGLVDLTKEPSGHWHADLTRDGTDVVEYTVNCDPGIARPTKYWK
ncbi:MAG: hypothetical protein WC825_09330 [Gallionellaceae bacterium]|jgi:hypothetical protein